MTPYTNVDYNAWYVRPVGILDYFHVYDYSYGRNLII